jgi:hypothetical protein
VIAIWITALKEQYRRETASNKQGNRERQCTMQ